MLEQTGLEGCRLTRQVYLIGFMGAGKTSVARCLSQALGLDAVDADVYLEAKEGRTIASIFAQDGEDCFRDLEAACLKELSLASPHLISCGGGVVKRAENMDTMRAHGFVVYLEVTADQALARIPDTASRPLLEDLDAARRIVAERQPLYQRAADACVQTAGRSIEQVADEVARLLVSEGVLVCR